MGGFYSRFLLLQALPRVYQVIRAKEKTINTIHDTILKSGTSGRKSELHDNLKQTVGLVKINHSRFLLHMYKVMKMHILQHLHTKRSASYFIQTI